MKRYAVIDPEGTVANVIIWDEVSPWEPPEGHSLVNVEEIFCDIGWKHNNGVFTKPEPVTDTPAE